MSGKALCRALAAMLAFAFFALPAAGSTEPTLVADLSLEPRDIDLRYQPLGLLGDEALVILTGVTPDPSLWITDGTLEGSRPLAEMCGGSSVLAARTDGVFLAGCGLWFTDGTPEGTRFLAYPKWFQDPAVGGAALVPGTGLLVFPGPSGEVMVSDGTHAGTRVLAVPRPGELGPQARRFTSWNGRVVFLVSTGDENWEVWSTDGTEAGTIVVKELTAVPLYTRPSFPVTRPFPASDLGLYFIDPAEGGDELWVTGGTPGSTHALPGALPDDARVNEEFFLSAGDAFLFEMEAPGQSGIWALDDGQTRLLIPGHLGELDEAGIEIDGLRFFVLGPDRSHSELWVSDGTPAGTHTVRVPCAASCASDIRLLTDLGDGRLLLSATVSPPEFTQIQLYATDGTGPAVPLLTAGDPEFYAASWAVSPEPGRAWVGLSSGGAQPSAIWTTDGTPAGTEPVYEAETYHETWVPLLIPGGRLWFLEEKFYGQPDQRLMSLTDSGAEEVGFHRGRPGDSNPLYFTAFGGGAVFALNEGENDNDLYALPPGADAPLRLVDTDTRPVNEYEVLLPPPPPVELGGKLYYLAPPEGTTARSLWRVEPSLDPAVAVTSLPHGDVHHGPFVMGDEMFWFVAGDELFGPLDLWASDGTAAGTRLVASGVAPSSRELPSGTLEAVELGGRLYFPGANGQLRWTDGTELGSVPPDTGSFPAVSPPLRRLGNQLLFFAGREGARRLWATRGTPETTHSLNIRNVPSESEMEVVGGVAYYAGLASGSGYELWRTDGTPEGTYLVHDIVPGPNGSFPEQMTPFHGRLYFIVHLPTGATEIWRTDATGQGAERVVADLYPGVGSSDMSGLTAAGDTLLWSARQSPTGKELWGLVAGSEAPRRLTDLWPGPGSSYPEEMTLLGSRLFFSAIGPDVGREAWWLPADALAGGCEEGPGDLCLLGGRVRVRVSWTDQRSGKSGAGTAVPYSDKTGLFWFFDDANIELVVKALDGTDINGHIWGFYGALSDVLYRVEMTDTETGEVRVFENPAGEICGGADTKALPVDSAAADGWSVAGAAAGRVASFPSSSPLPGGRGGLLSRAAGTCAADAETLCLLDGRFAVTVDWDNQRAAPGEPNDAGTGTVIPSLGDGDKSGYFWFFDSANIELVVKALDGTAKNGHFWFFYGALSDVEYTITVRDTLTGAEQSYHNAPGNLCGGADTRAFME